LGHVSEEEGYVNHALLQGLLHGKGKQDAIHHHQARVPLSVRRERQAIHARDAPRRRDGSREGLGGERAEAGKAGGRGRVPFGGAAVQA